MKKNNLFTILTKFLIFILPFYVIIKVYFSEILLFSFFGFFIKELIVVLLFLALCYEYFKSKKRIKFDVLDYSIFTFIIYGIIITIFNGGGIKEMIFGGRYDFLGFIVFFIFKHGQEFLKIKRSSLIKLFFISASISIFLGLLIKFVLGEEFLQLFGFSIYVADFNFKGGIPIYQGVEASGIRRFQGILDSPLAMGAFLIIFLYLFTYLNRKKLNFAYNLGSIFLGILIFLTYSRAALLGFGIGFILFLIFKFKKSFKKYKKNIFSVIIVFILLIGGFSYIFQDKLYNIFVRHGSTSGHFSRMTIGFQRFINKPLGYGLASSGPAYRNFVKDISLKTDRYYIPESWFIQILVEGGIIYFGLYIFILYLILGNLYINKNYCIFSMFMGILIMSLFLHIFEYTYVTILLYIFLALFFKGNLQKNLKII